MTDYTADRFLSPCSKKVAAALRKAWKDGDALVAKDIPKEALPAVMMLAAWGERINVSIVDDYAELVDRTEQILKDGNVHHPDLFMASAIVIMARRGQDLSVGGFELLNIPGLFEEFFDLGE